MASRVGVLVHLPQELHFLIEPALKYGFHRSDSEREKRKRRLTEEDLDVLAATAERYRLSDLHDEIGDFFDKFSISEYSEAAKLYWLFGLMDELGLQFSPEINVDTWINMLQRYGSFRLAGEWRNDTCGVRRGSDESRSHFAPIA
ncbi:MAG: hypothetical protein K2X38_22190 [Gemmataceae bacterium]|nr:hypothetical protein [Gemmataceae bacterium]